MKLHSKILGKGQPLFILHGFLGMGDNWKTLSNKISAQNFQVHLIDARNHGRSFHADEFSYQVMVDDLYSYAKTKNIDNFILLGHSMGGKTAMLFASIYPLMVSKLVVVDIAPRYYPIHHDAILKGLEKVASEKLTSRSRADEILAGFVGDLGTRQFLLKNLYWTKEKTLSLRINLPVLNEEVGEVGESLPATAIYNGSTLFLKGDKSEYISVSDQSDIKKHFPNNQIITISNSGHWLHAENPDEFLDKLLDFIQN